MLTDLVHPLVLLREPFTLKKAFDWLSKFECQHCADCCRIKIHVTEKEQKLIAKTVGVKVKNLPIKDNIIQPPCDFLVNDFCSIYPVRPLMCRMFPTKNEKGRFALQLDCPAVKKIYGEMKWL